MRISKYHLCVLSSESPHSVDRTIPLAELGYMITFIANAPFDTVEKLYDYKNVKVIFWREIEPERKRFRLSVLIDLVRELKPDAVIVHFCGYNRFHAAVFAGVRPVIGILMGSDVITRPGTLVPLHVKLEMIFTKLFLPYINLLAAKTNHIKEKVSGWGLKGRIITIPWGVWIPQERQSVIYDKLALRRMLGLPERAWIVFAPRTLSYNSRLVEVVKGFSKCADEVSNAFLVISEKGALYEYLQSVNYTLKNLGIQALVKFVPQIPQEKMEQYYRASDVIISNSLWDGMPQTAFEAALYKSTLLLSDLPQYHEYFEDGKSAIYMDGTPKSIAKRLKYIHDNPEISTEIGRQAREEVIQKANIEKWAERFIKELDEVISNSEKIELPWYRLLMGKALLFLIVMFRRPVFSRIKVMV